MIIIEYNLFTGHPSQIESTLKRSIAQYISNNKLIKIGITNNVDNRAKQHYYKNISWKKMVVLYETTSLNYVSQIESNLIDFFWDSVDNEIGGGGGNFGESPYFLYILIQ